MEDIMIWLSFYKSPLMCYILSYLFRKAATDIIHIPSSFFPSTY